MPSISVRNVYVLMDYGDFILGSDRKNAPYVQFLSTTNATEAHDDFVKERLSIAIFFAHKLAVVCEKEA
ncbi:hypothetical protein C0993_006282 [Termitomyces sp. T159_Od127]|nr:hypothetical protein C0993_006282 [Termitomyces sp. T159_Od127]